MQRHFFAALCGVALLAPVAPAFAHVTLETPEAAAGSTYKAILRVGHGCDGKATSTLRVRIPEGFYDAKPMPKAGWTLNTKVGDYDRPFDNHGQQMTQGVREIIWSGGDLQDGWYDEFVLRGKVGPDVVPGSALYFPVVQECGRIKEEWINVTGGEKVENPAPSLTVTPAATMAPAHDHDHGQAAMAPQVPAAPVTVGQLTILDGYSRATLPGAPVAGGFLTVVNAGEADDRLVSASTPAAGRVELHEMQMNGNVMKMRELPDGVPVPAGERVELKPGGYHLMLMQLTAPLREGDTIPLTLQFERAGTVSVTLGVGPANATGVSHVAD